MSLLAELQSWYESQCDEDWEHQYGVVIESLDNPGWWMKIDLTGTGLEGRQFEEVSDLEPERDWIKCYVEDGKFHGAGGPRMLERILETFLTWAKGEGGARHGAL